METGRLIAYRDAVAEHLRGAFPEIPRVDTHFGPFDLDELKSFSLRAPAIRVTILGWAPTEQVPTRELDCSVHAAAYFVTRSTASLKADVASLNMAETVAAHLSVRSFTKFSEPATNIACQNHYSGAVREFSGGIALFSLDWRAVVRIGRNVTKERYASTEHAADAVNEISVSLNGGEPHIIGGTEP